MYRREVEELADWCKVNSLNISVDKKERDFSRGS